MGITTQAREHKMSAIDKLFALRQDDMEKRAAGKWPLGMFSKPRDPSAPVAAVGKSILGMLGVGAGLTAGGLGVSKAVGAIDDAWDRRGKNKAYSAMLADDSELRRMNKSSPKKVRSHFNTLFRFNPEMAKDPLVASSFVRGTAGQDAMSHKTVQDLVSARKSIKDMDNRKLPNLPTI
jgi:hypothetical protein